MTTFSAEKTVVYVHGSLSPRLGCHRDSRPECAQEAVAARTSSSVTRPRAQRRAEPRGGSGIGHERLETRRIPLCEPVSDTVRTSLRLPRQERVCGSQRPAGLRRGSGMAVSDERRASRQTYTLSL